MQQVKIFKGVENGLETLEGEINDWIRTSGANVLAITGNIAPQSEGGAAASGGLGASGFPPSDVILIVLYQTTG